MKNRVPAVVRILSVFLAVAPVAVFLATVPGCNTVQGVGQDISNASTDVEDSIFGGGKSHTGTSTRRR